jgi:hypothetical protein
MLHPREEETLDESRRERLLLGDDTVGVGSAKSVGSASTNQPREPAVLSSQQWRETPSTRQRKKKRRRQSRFLD